MKTTLLPLNKRVICTVDMDLKNNYQLTNDIVIRMERHVNEGDGRVWRAVNAICVNGEGLKKGVELLLEHNASDGFNQIYDHDIELPENTVLLSVSEGEVLLWRDKYEPEDKFNGWQLYKDVLIAAFIYEPYKGCLIDIPTKKVNNVMFVLRGEHEGKAVRVGKAVGYTSFYQEGNGRDNTITTMRNDEYELFAIDCGITQKVLNGELLIGSDVESAKKYSPVAIAQ